MNNVNLSMNDGESVRSYLYRVGNMKDSGIIDYTWNELSEILNKETGNDWNEITYRKKYAEGVAWRDEVFGETMDDSYIKQLREETAELKKQRVLVRDERTELNKAIRESARFGDMLNLIASRVAKVSKSTLPDLQHTPIVSGNNIIVTVSDWHIGQTFQNEHGSYSTEIAADRVAQYLCHIEEIIETYRPENCYVTLLGDHINGLIHKNIRVADRENIIEQVITASELISNFVYKISTKVNHVYVHSVGGNHSRLFPNKEECAANELLDNLIPWYMQAKLAHISNITVSEEMHSTYFEMNVCGKTVVGVHGDKDGMNDASLGHLVMWLGKKPDMILMGHKHYAALSTYYNIPVVQSGSMVGSGDQFTTDHRLANQGSQSVIVMNSDGMKALLPITLK